MEPFITIGAESGMKEALGISREILLLKHTALVPPIPEQLILPVTISMEQ